jgi:zinc protease
MTRSALVRLAAAFVATLSAAAAAMAAPPPHGRVQVARPAPAAPPPVSPVPKMDYTYRELPNGLKVYAVRDTRTPNVAVQVWYQVGSKDDPQGRSGFAHLFEHLMFKATRDLPPESFDRLTEDVGGSNNASTNDDYTEYHEVVPANYLQPILWAEAERMGSLVVDEAAFKSERSVVEEELRQRVLAQPYGELFYLLLPEVSYRISPYGRPTIGSIPNLEAATLADVQAFHAVWYRPDNAVLVVVGNFDPDKLNRWVDDYFGKIKKPAWPIPPRPASEPLHTAPQIWTAYAANTPLPAVLFAFQAPAAANPDTPALEVADAILSRGDSSRLHQSLVYRQQIATDAFTFLEPHNQPSNYGAGVILAQGVTPARGQAALRAEIAAMRTQPPTPEELNRAKNQLVTQILEERETASGKAQELAAAVVLYGEASRVNRQVADIEKVTAADVLRVTRKYWNDATRGQVVFLSDAAKPKTAIAHGPSPQIQAEPLIRPSGVQVFVLAPPDQRQKPPAPSAPVPFHAPTPAERSLANGMRVIVVGNHSLPLVSAALIVGEGGAGDPQRLPGLANMTADLVTKGAGGRTAPQIARDIEALGGSMDSQATYDASSLALTVQRDALGRAMPIFADVARRPTFAPAELDRERKQALNDLAVSMTDPSALAGWTAARAVYGAAPYGEPLSGAPRSLAAMTPKDATAFHAAWWRPDLSTLVLSGDITPEQGFDLAQRWFGDWARPGAPPPSAPPPAGPPSPPKVIVVDLPNAGQAAVVVARRALERRDPRYYPAQVADQVLGGGYSSRLNEEIRVKRGLSYGANSGMAFRRAPGPFLASTQTKNESAPEVVDLILQQMKGMAATPASPEELKARQSTLIGQFGRQVETNSGVAGAVGSLALYDIDLGELGRYVDKVSAVTAGEVQSVSAQVLDPGPASIIVVGDAKAFLPALKAKHPDVEVIPIADFDLDSPTLRKGR